MRTRRKSMEPQTSFDATFGELPEGRHAIAIIGQSGDTKVTWDPARPAEVEAARRQFDELTGGKHRYRAFRITDGDGRGEQMEQFDPNARRILLVPPMQGG